MLSFEPSKWKIPVSGKDGDWSPSLNPKRCTNLRIWLVEGRFRSLRRSWTGFLYCFLLKPLSLQVKFDQLPYLSVSRICFVFSQFWWHQRFKTILNFPILLFALLQAWAVTPSLAVTSSGTCTGGWVGCTTSDSKLTPFIWSSRSLGGNVWWVSLSFIPSSVNNRKAFILSLHWFHLQCERS